MRRTLALVMVMGLGGGCATFGFKSKSTNVDDAKLVRLPQADRDQVLEAEKNVNRASSNVTAAKVAKDEANRFCGVSDAELDAAKAKQKAADKAIKLGRSAQSQSTFDAGTQNGQAAQQERLAAEAKKAYCSSLVDARDARVEASEAEVVSAKASEELLKVQLLQKENMANGIDRNPYADAKAKADEKLSRKRLEVSQREGEAAALRTTWEQRSRASNQAGREIDAPAMKAPAPPTMTPAPDNN